MTKLLFKNATTDLVFIWKHAYYARIMFETLGYHGDQYKDCLLRGCDTSILVNVCHQWEDSVDPCYSPRMQNKCLLKRQYFHHITRHRLPNNVNILVMLQELFLLSVLHIVFLQCQLFSYLWVFAGQICQWYGIFKHVGLI